jgi:hypothetical protein
MPHAVNTWTAAAAEVCRHVGQEDGVMGKSREYCAHAVSMQELAVLCIRKHFAPFEQR